MVNARIYCSDQHIENEHEAWDLETKQQLYMKLQLLAKEPMPHKGLAFQHMYKACAHIREGLELVFILCVSGLSIYLQDGRKNTYPMKSSM